MATTTLTALNEGLGAIFVNSNFPTFAGSSLVAQGNTVCAIWHGYYGSAGAGREEVTARCSQNAGAAWQAPMRVSDSATRLSIFPALALDAGPEGLLHFAWAEYTFANNTYEPFAIFYRNNREEASGSPTVFLPLVMRAR